uniref:Uncharacterized protein n=1 Tax=Eutreptiella gymnastica TaxID=73025 RepID=A0A7S4LH24_9EUGL
MPYTGSAPKLLVALVLTVMTTSSSAPSNTHTGRLTDMGPDENTLQFVHPLTNQEIKTDSLRGNTRSPEAVTCGCPPWLHSLSTVCKLQMTPLMFTGVESFHAVNRDRIGTGDPIHSVRHGPDV